MNLRIEVPDSSTQPFSLDVALNSSTVMRKEYGLFSRQYNYPLV